MTAPDTNIERQKRRHMPVLIGLATVAIFAAIMFMANFGAAVDDPADQVPQGIELNDN